MGLKPRPKFLIGDRVTVPYGPYDLEAEIVENRGRIRGDEFFYRVKCVTGRWAFISEYPESWLRKSNAHRGEG